MKNTKYSSMEGIELTDLAKELAALSKLYDFVEMKVMHKYSLDTNPFSVLYDVLISYGDIE